MLKLKRTKVVAMAVAMLLALSGNVTGVLAEQGADGKAQAAQAVHADVPLTEDGAASSENATESAVQDRPTDPTDPETPVEPKEQPDAMDGNHGVGGSPDSAPQRVLYVVRYLDPDGGEYLSLEMEAFERLEEPPFTPMLKNHTFEYWYQEIPIDPDCPSLGMVEEKITFGVLIDRDYDIFAKLAQTPAEEEPVPQPDTAGEAGSGGKNAEGNGGEAAEPRQAQEPNEQAGDALRDEPRQENDDITIIGTRSVGDIINVDDLEIIIIADNDPAKDAVEDETDDTVPVEDEEDEGEFGAIFVDEEDAGEEEVIFEEEMILEDETDEAAIVDEEDDALDEETGETATEADADPGLADPEITDVMDDELGMADGELEMSDDEVPLAGCAVNVYTSHQPFMLEGETLEVWAELIGFDHVDVLLQWQFSSGDGEWRNVPGATDLSYALTATKETVNYTWRLAVAVIG